jgi:hypothetical protein
VVARQDQSDDELKLGASKAASKDAHHSQDRAMEITRIGLMIILSFFERYDNSQSSVPFTLQK